jgi:hypothetical protein
MGGENFMKRNSTKLLSIVIIASLLMTSLFLLATTNTAVAEPTVTKEKGISAMNGYKCTDTSPLMAGKDFQVGWVTVDTIGDSLIIEFEITAHDWYLMNVQVGISSKDPQVMANYPNHGIPQTKTGYPILEWFPIKHSFNSADHEVSYSVSLSLTDLGLKGGDCVFIAAHAKVFNDNDYFNNHFCKPSNKLEVGAWADGYVFNGRISATFFCYYVPTEPIVCVESSPLMAGKDLQVGMVYVERVGGDIIVTFHMDMEGWYLLETNVALSKINPRSTTEGGIPQTSTRNPIPGKFPLGHSYEITDHQCSDEVRISLADLGAVTGDCVYVAAHANVAHVTHECLVISSGTNTEWSGDEVNWYDAVPCWTQGLWPSIIGAAWVWRTYETDPQYEYDNVPEGGWYFREQFTLPDEAFSIKPYMVNITADNAYTIAINGVPLGGDGAMDRDGPDFQGWNNIDAYVIPAGTITPGENEMQIRAMNYLPNGDPHGNPAGLIYLDMVCYDDLDQSESAWAAGYDFKGTNWATFFCYEVKESMEKPKILVVVQYSLEGSIGEYNLLIEYLDTIGLTGNYISIWEPDQGLLPEMVIDYDLIIYDAWGYPPGWVNLVTIDTLKTFFNDGGGLILIGDDISRIFYPTNQGDAPYFNNNPEYANDWEEMTRMHYVNNGMGDYIVEIGTIVHPVINGIEGRTFTYLLDVDTTVYMPTSGSYLLANAINTYPELIDEFSGAVITAYDSPNLGGKVVTIGVPLYDDLGNQAIPSDIAFALLDNSIEWMAS